MHCELCGKDRELFTAIVEGTQLHVCAGCGRFGKVLSRTQPSTLRKSAPVKQEPVMIEQTVGDYAQRIRAARERHGMTQEEFAKRIMVKESLVHKMETSQFEPPLDLARKLEKLLRITLVEIREESTVQTTKEKSPPAGLTIGDILKFKP